MTFFKLLILTWLQRYQAWRTLRYSWAANTIGKATVLTLIFHSFYFPSWLTFLLSSTKISPSTDTWNQSYQPLNMCLLYSICKKRCERTQTVPLLLNQVKGIKANNMTLNKGVQNRSALPGKSQKPVKWRGRQLFSPTQNSPTHLRTMFYRSRLKTLILTLTLFENPSNS